MLIKKILLLFGGLTIDILAIALLATAKIQQPVDTVVPNTTKPTTVLIGSPNAALQTGAGWLLFLAGSGGVVVGSMGIGDAIGNFLNSSSEQQNSPIPNSDTNLETYLATMAPEHRQSVITALNLLNNEVQDHEVEVETAQGMVNNQNQEDTEEPLTTHHSPADPVISTPSSTPSSESSPSGELVKTVTSNQTLSAPPKIPFINDQKREEHSGSLGLLKVLIPDEWDTQRHILISAITRSGKTVSLRAMMHEIKAVHGEVIFSVVDPKKDEDGWMGLEDFGCVSYPIESPEDGISRIKAAADEVRRRNQTGHSNHHPYFLIVDEFSTLYDDAKVIKKDFTVSADVKLIVRQGLAKKVCLIVVGQSHLVEDVGMNSQARNNLILVALGRHPQWVNVDAIVNDQYIFPNKEIRDNLKSRVAKLQTKAEKRPVMVTNYSGGQAEILPDITRFKEQRIVDLTG